MKVAALLFTVATVTPAALACFEFGNVECADGRCWCPRKECGPGRQFQRYHPTTNGCGSKENPVWMWHWDVHCCDDHDRCYSTKGKTRDECDEKFCSCLSGWSVGWWCGIANQRFWISDSYYHEAQKEDVGCWYAHENVSIREGALTRSKGRRLEVSESEWTTEEFQAQLARILAPKEHGVDGAPVKAVPAVVQASAKVTAFTATVVGVPFFLFTCFTCIACFRLSKMRAAAAEKEFEKLEDASGDIEKLEDGVVETEKSVDTALETDIMDYISVAMLT